MIKISNQSRYNHHTNTTSVQDHCDKIEKQQSAYQLHQQQQQQPLQLNTHLNHAANAVVPSVIIPSVQKHTQQLMQAMAVRNLSALSSYPPHPVHGQLNQLNYHHHQQQHHQHHHHQQQQQLNQHLNHLNLQINQHHQSLLQAGQINLSSQHFTPPTAPQQLATTSSTHLTYATVRSTLLHIRVLPFCVCVFMWLSGSALCYAVQILRRWTAGSIRIPPHLMARLWLRVCACFQL